MQQIQKIKQLNELELSQGLTDTASWHDQYKNSAYIYVGGLDLNLTEGDVITIFSQYGEIVDINLIRDKETGKSKGYGFLAFEDQRSTVLAIDNLNGYKLLNRMLRVDHVANYKGPSTQKDYDPEKERERRNQIRPWHLKE